MIHLAEGNRQKEEDGGNVETELRKYGASSLKWFSTREGTPTSRLCHAILKRLIDVFKVDVLEIVHSLEIAFMKEWQTIDPTMDNQPHKQLRVYANKKPKDKEYVLSEIEFEAICLRK
ncbi:uncharacterized protein SOCG_02115 [Schizosaccharomyces octosporus yFS286]|uniref:Uncharacterized protein n=1 Tax=Schizosaccharomyces octosporus (strain yFS286) TaxID=483514 RepID=S9Q3J6_SCHOY|nr:uncharacterized protein SOCG_02115 [Schizosaccharomyces octosporus yFS286]EPX74632.1 hypothetical protein SOCG_02115 [Schizosaccharomyces octosporus yFS286]